MTAEEALKYLQFIEHQQRALNDLNEKKQKLEEFQRQVSMLSRVWRLCWGRSFNDVIVVLCLLESQPYS